MLLTTQKKSYFSKRLAWMSVSNNLCLVFSFWFVAESRLNIFVLKMRNFQQLCKRGGSEGGFSPPKQDNRYKINIQSALNNTPVGLLQN